MTLTRHEDESYRSSEGTTLSAFPFFLFTFAFLSFNLCSSVLCSASNSKGPSSDMAAEKLSTILAYLAPSAADMCSSRSLSALMPDLSSTFLVAATILIVCSTPET